MASHVVRARRRRSSVSASRGVGASRRRSDTSRRLRYAFDNSLSRGPIALIGWLAVLSAVVVVVGAAILVLLQVAPADGEPLSGPEAAWQAMMRAIDAGGVGGDAGWAFRAVMLLVTIGGLFIVSTLIGVLTTGIEGRLEQLRKGRSVVVEHGHTLVLGWSPKVMVILAELAVANANVARPRVVVLADQDKVEMEDAIRAEVGEQLGRTRVICRSGNPLSTVDLAIGSPSTARSVILLTPEEEETDRFVLRGLLALSDPAVREPGDNHIVATLQDPASTEIAGVIAGDDVRLLHVGDLIARITAQTCRQSGLSVVYQELLDFDGDEIYFQSEPGLVGTPWREAILAHEEATLIGLRRAGGAIALNPPPDTVIAADDVLIAIAADDDRVVLPPTPVAAPIPAHVVDVAPATPGAEHTLVIGWNERGTTIVEQLDAYVPAGSTVDVVTARGLDGQLDGLTRRLERIALTTSQADATRRSTLEGLDLERYHHVIILADEATSDRDEADTDTMVTLLHLRDLAARRGLAPAVVTEVLDVRNRALLRTTSADDFIVSEQLVSLLIAQVSENPELHAVFEDLFNAEGAEIYLRPAGEYVQTSTATPFSTVVAAATARGETTLGYRYAAQAEDPDAGYGVVVNPPKSTPVSFSPEDKVIVLAQE